MIQNEIPNLCINLNVLGWGYSGGKSGNVWGIILSSNFPIEVIRSLYKLKGKKSCLFTCLDDQIYSSEPINKYMSATFKPCYDNYSAVSENLAMKIMFALDLPTSYNYLVGFSKKELYDNAPKEYIDYLENYNKIVENMSVGQPKKPKDIGVVVVDFLKNEEQLMEIQLLLKHEQSAKLSTWIRVIKEQLKERFPNIDKELFDCNIKHLNSRIVRSYLARVGLLGDIDFTGQNCGIVFNNDKFNYAPNFDYGESFNKLITGVLNPPPSISEEALKQIRKFQPNYVPKTLEPKTVEKIANNSLDPIDEENIRFIVENFPNETREFLENVGKNLIPSSVYNLTHEYCNLTYQGKPLLTEKDADSFEKFINLRIRNLTSFIKEHTTEYNAE